MSTTTLTTQQLALILGGLALVYVASSAMVAFYGRQSGYPFFPLFVAAIFLGFPVVLLVITIAAGPVQARRNQ